MVKLLIIRHGETQLNLENKFQGSVDSPLTRLGRQQASFLAEKLAGTPIDYIYSSPLSRAMATADIVRGSCQNPIVTDHRLSEFRCDKWESLPLDDLSEFYPVEFTMWSNSPHLFKMDGGETFTEVYDRATAAIEDIIERHNNSTVLISTHMITTLLIMAYFGGESIEQLWNTTPQGNTALNIVDIEDNGTISIIIRGDLSNMEIKSLV